MGLLEQIFSKACQAVHGAMDVPEISVEELKALMDQKEDFLLIDVREKSEYEICSIPGARLIPMMDIVDKVGDLDKEKAIAVHCHHGGRSAQVVQFLKKNGFSRVVNVAGGVEAWADKIDSSMKKY